MHWIRDAFEFSRTLDRALRSVVLNESSPRELAKLWPKLAKQRGIPQRGETHYALAEETARAYSAYYLPANALKTYFVLEEMRRLDLPLETDLSVVDFGSGPGSALCGLALWGKENQAKIRYDAWDQSKYFLAQGERLTRALREEFPVEANWWHPRRSPFEFLKGREPRVVLFQNSVHEIFPDPNERARELEKILNYLKRLGGARYLILIEPALRESTRDLLELRQKLIDGRKARVWLPCLDNRACGALAQPNDWCHEEIPVDFPDWLNELGAAAGLRKEALLFSYLVLSHSELEVPGWHSDGYRMVSQRLERKGQTECFLCTRRGKIKARAQHSKATEDSKQLHEWVRGDLFSEVELAEAGDLKHATRLR